MCCLRNIFTLQWDIPVQETVSNELVMVHFWKLYHNFEGNSKKEDKHREASR